MAGGEHITNVIKPQKLRPTRTRDEEMKKAILPNGIVIRITDDQAKKIKFIQNCIRRQRTELKIKVTK